MLKTQTSDYLQKGLTTKIVNFHRDEFLTFSPKQRRNVENPVENVENIHFAVNNSSRKRREKSQKVVKNRVFTKKRQPESARAS